MILFYIVRYLGIKLSLNKSYTLSFRSDRLVKKGTWKFKHLSRKLAPWVTCLPGKPIRSPAPMQKQSKLVHICNLSSGKNPRGALASRKSYSLSSEHSERPCLKSWGGKNCWTYVIPTCGLCMCVHTCTSTHTYTHTPVAVSETRTRGLVCRSRGRAAVK